MATLDAAAVAYHVREVSGWNGYADHIAEEIQRCQGADLIVLPELVILELLTQEVVPEDKVLDYLLPYAEQHFDLIRNLAVRAKATIVGGSCFWKKDGKVRNVAPIADPEGRLQLAPKNRLTQYEKEIWGLSGNDGLNLNYLPLAVNICYDVQFPESCRTIAENGGKILAVPTYTEGKQGARRVQWCAEARCIENQMFVIMASLHGAIGREPLVNALGTTAIYAPSKPPFPEDSVLAVANHPGGIARAMLDLDALDVARHTGPVTPWLERHPVVWTECPLWP